jgi:hypothetical protein
MLHKHESTVPENLLEKLSREQAHLSQVLDCVIADLKQEHTGSSNMHLVEASVVLRKHLLAVRVAMQKYKDNAQAQDYIDQLNALRRDMATRLTMSASGIKDVALSEEFEHLCWQSLATGVLWLDSLREFSDSQPQSQSLAGEHWQRMRHPVDPEALAAQRLTYQLEDSSDIELDQMLYCSLARDPLTESELDNLADQAARWNKLDKISGMIMYGDGVFVQLFEGPRDAVADLWARLLRDKRHHGVTQLFHRTEVQERSCDGFHLQMVPREQLKAIIHEAKQEIVHGRKTVWAPAIERMDFLLSQTEWSCAPDKL